MNGFPNLPTATAVALQKFVSAPLHGGTALPARRTELADGRCMIVIGGETCVYANSTYMDEAWCAMLRRGAIYEEAPR